LIYTASRIAPDANLPIYFKWAEDILPTLREPHHKIGFVLQTVYFKAASKFFTSNRFHKSDAEFVAQLMGFNKRQIRLKHYRRGLTSDHRDLLDGLLEKSSPSTRPVKIRGNVADLDSLLGDVILQCVQSTSNAAATEHKEQVFRDKAANH
jgi:hypothetical protein